jgi:DNA mismatch repair ATPase MutL
LSINPEEIDVNVHPRKQEIRFAREQEIYRAFYHAILGKLENSSLVGDSNNVIANHSEAIQET